MDDTQNEILHENEMLSVLDDINDFTNTKEFDQLLQELRNKKTREERQLFVKNVIIDKEEQKKRGLQVPEGIMIQRSYFTDDRPTLFCVVKYLPNGIAKMTITYDDAVKAQSN